MTKKEIKRQLGLESGRMLQTVESLNRLMAQRRSIRKRWKKEKALRRIVSVDLWHEFFDSCSRVGHDLHRASATATRMTSLLTRLGLRPTRLVALPETLVEGVRTVLHDTKLSCAGPQTFD